MTSFGDRLKFLRVKSKMTQDELASHLGYKRRMIQFLESNEREPNLDTLQKICELFDVSADFLLGNKKIMEYEPDIETGLAKVNVVERIREGEEAIVVGANKVLVDPTLIKGAKVIAQRIEDDSMIGDNIKKGDIVVIVNDHEIGPQDIASFVVDNKFYLRRLSKTEDLIILTASNPDFPPIIKKKGDEPPVLTHGKVVQVIRSFE